jgi:hypothetical protein
MTKRAKNLSIALLAMGLYMLSFTAIYFTVGHGMGISGVIPPVIVAYLFGLRAGVCAGVLMFPVTCLMCILLNVPDWFEKITVLGHVSIVVIAVAVGRIHDLNILLRKELGERKKAEQQREELIRELTRALSEVKTLSGLLPICASCKNVRNDKGYWEQIEKYIGDRSDAEFSHGLCPACAKKLYPEYFKA